MIEVRGRSEAEVYARAALALGKMLAGGGPMTQSVERTIEPAGHDRVTLLVGLLRDVLAQFYDERLILAAIDVRLGTPLSATGRFTHWDPARHHGAEIKGVSYGGARLERDGADGWMAVAVLER